MSNNRIIGMVLLAVGIILLVFGFQASESLGEQLHESFTGRFTESTTWYFILGAAGTVAGLALLIKR